jgi:hypothetical protein
MKWLFRETLRRLLAFADLFPTTANCMVVLYMPQGAFEQSLNVTGASPTRQAGKTKNNESCLIPRAQKNPCVPASQKPPVRCI